MGTDDMTHGYCISSSVLHIVDTGWILKLLCDCSRL